MRRAAYLWLFLLPGLGAQTGVDSEALLARITAKVRESLRDLPNYVCIQTIERSRRRGSTASYQPLDTLRVEVGLVDNRELYSWPGADRFEDQELAEMIGRGVIGTGNFALLAKHVFLSRVAEFTWRGEEMVAARRTVRFDYVVPRNLSSYKLRVPPNQATVGFDGSFWADANSLELVRLEVRATEIPGALGLAEAITRMDYERVAMGPSSFLMPQSSELRMTTLLGEESRNTARFTGCRRYQSASNLSFDEHSADRIDPAAAVSTPDLPAGSVAELALAEEISLETAAAGDPVRAVLAHDVKDGERVMAPAGAAMLGHLVRVEREALPFDHYIVGFQFETLEAGERKAKFTATMVDAGPSAGLIRQAKRMNPTFTRQRSARLDILVQEHHPGQGVVQWDARHASIPKGFKMRWRVEGSR